MENRNKILFYSLMMEEASSAFICALIGIKDTKGSLSFGITSSSLSFYNKINLLIDIGAIEKDDMKKFEKFMAIRNKFMHVMAIDSYTRCVESIDGLEKNLLKWQYLTQKNNYTENEYFTAIDNLSLDLLKIIVKIVHQVKDKIKLDINNKLNEDMITLFLSKKI